MSFQLKISNSLEKLAESLSRDLLLDASPILSKVRIVTQTTGMNRWLSISLAAKNQVFANFEYLKPNAFIDEVVKLAGLEKSMIFSNHHLQWQIFSLLNDDEFKNRFKQVAAFYKNDDLKRMQLAAKVADLFDQYSIYRPDFIRRWNQGGHPEIKSHQHHERWQSWLWQTIRKRFPEQPDDRVTLIDKLKEKMLNDQQFIEKLKENYPKISVFGLSILTRIHIELFKLLGTHIQVNFYFVNPSPETYWYDTKSEKHLAAIEDATGQDPDELLFEKGNELLMNYGRVIRDTFLMLFDEATLDTLDNSNLLERANDSLLHKIQNDIYKNSTDEKQKIYSDDLEDSSLQINSSYTQVRELEALYNYLLNLFENQNDLLPKDIIILTTDIDLYTPYIKAVFDNVPGKSRIPYSIADRAYAGGDNIVGVIDMILNLSEEEFSSEKVVQLLDSAYIRVRYGITNTDIIRDVIRESNIRTGISGEVENNTNYVSWSYGIRRLILGYAIKGDDAYENEGDAVYPVDQMEGETAREVLRFIDLVDDLKQSLALRHRKRTLTAWKDYLIDQIVNRFIFVKNENDREYKYVIDKLASLDGVAAYFTDEVGFTVFKKSIIDLLFGESRSGDFITGSVTFSSLIPMRSLPFKVVAVLGLDNKKFPRTKVDPEFNLIATHRQPDDRNVKDNDKHLFLETLLAADEHLYLSYIGRNTKDNAKIPPSLLIDELINYVSDSYQGKAEDVIEKLVTHHPLHSFSSRYNSTDNKLYSYSKETSPDAEKPAGSIPDNKELDFSKITLEELIWFFKNPFKWYYNKTLKIYYNDEEVLLPEFEKFELNKLDEYLVKTTILKSIDQKERLSFIDKEKKLGMLPLANMAELSMETVEAELKHIKDILDTEKQGSDEERETISIQFDGIKLEGSVQEIYNGKCLAYSLSGKKGGSNMKAPKSGTRKYILEAWLKHLALIASGKPKDTLFVWNFDDSPVTIPADILTEEEAKSTLSELIKLFIAGHNIIMPFDPSVGFNIVFYGDDLEGSFDNLRKIGETNYNKSYLDTYYKMEIEKEYFDTDKSGYNEKLQMMNEVAETVWQHLFREGEILK